MQPNLVLLLADQLRPDFLGCYGAGFLRTPAIDDLAKHGNRYNTAVSPCPLCVPARASLLTGQHAHATGVMHNLAWLRPDRREMGIHTWPEQLQCAGYRTASMGKMHFYPWDLSEGFETRVIAEDKRHIAIQDDYYNALIAAGYEKEHAREYKGYTANKGASINPLPDELQVDRWVTKQTVDYLHTLTGDQPFALMVGFPGPHCPYDPPSDALATIKPGELPAPIPSTMESRAHHDAFVKAYKAPWAELDYSTLTVKEIRLIRHHYAALVERIDADVNTILQTLQSIGKLDNTIVVFASDHGDYLGDFDLMGKTTFHEPSIRVPLIVTDYRCRNAAVTQTPVSLLDLYPSILTWASLPVPAYADGMTLDNVVEDRCIVGVTTHGVMAKDNRWKLVRYANGVEALFDLVNDPHEQHNQIATRVDERQRLDAELTRSLIHGMQSANADKQVSEAKSPASHIFFARGWDRPYPAKM